LSVKADDAVKAFWRVEKSLSSRWFLAGLLLLLVITAVPRLLTVNFSLPYIDQPDEPNYNLAALNYRGEFDQDPSLYRPWSPKDNHFTVTE